MGTTLRVATVNILNDLSRWAERRPLLVGGLAARSPDLIALQEVADPLGRSTAHRLADDLGGYSVHACPKTGWARRWEGIAVLSRLPVGAHEPLDLGSQQRTAQVVHLRVGTRPVVLINGHYFWPVGAHAAQVRQVQRVLDRVGAFAPGTSVIVCGDFNATPGSRAVALMDRAFDSAHRVRHGREPGFTWPTALICGGRVRRRIARAIPVRACDLWSGCLDYIFVSPDVRVVECGVFLDRPSPDDPTLYASDHLGLAAILEVPSPEAS